MVRLNSLTQRASVIAYVIVASAGIGFFTADLFALDRGFSFGDESYYALSYKMAAKGFYPHFTNTPFLIAPLFEWLQPGLVFYRTLHLVLALGSSIILVFAIARYATPPGRSSKKLTLGLLPFALCYAPYSYYLSAPAFSYNHLNELLVLVSEACLLFAPRARRPAWLCLFAGALTALDIYVKPPTFLQLGVVNLALIGLLFWKRTPWKLAILYYFLGGLISLGLLTAFLVTPADWAHYLEFMHSHQTHQPLKVLRDFLVTGGGMIATGGPFIVATLLALALLQRFPRHRLISPVLFACPLAIVMFVAYLIFKPGDNQILGNCWIAWKQASTILVGVTILYLCTAVMALWRRTEDDRKQLVIVIGLLALNPIIISLGTLNGFGQVQLVGLSWFLIGGLVFFLLRRENTGYSPVYFSILLTATVCVFATYYARQWMPMNPLGEGALLDQIYQVPAVPALRHMRVDAETRDALTKVNAILDRYPGDPVVAFFDIPGLQYASGRPWIIRDPWLSDMDVPKTRDDVYNCNLFSKNAAAFHNSVFVVAHQDEMSPELQACLATIGFPENLTPLGQVTMPSFLGNYPVSLYLYP